MHLLCDPLGEHKHEKKQPIVLLLIYNAYKKINKKTSLKKLVLFFCLNNGYQVKYVGGFCFVHSLSKYGILILLAGSFLKQRV